MSRVGLAGYRAHRRPPARPAPAGPLQLAGLRRRYGRTAALDGLSFTVEPGQIFGFLGPNGAGKTTAMRIVMGIEPSDEGTVRWGGRPLTHTDRLAAGLARSTPHRSPVPHARGGSDE